MSDQLLDFSKLTPKQQTAIRNALMRMAQDADVPTEVDTSQEPIVMVSHDINTPNAYYVRGDKLVDTQGNEYGNDKHKGFAIDPLSGARLGHAPVLYNGRKIESLEHHVGLRVGDTAVLAKYANDSPTDTVYGRDARGSLRPPDTTTPIDVEEVRRKAKELNFNNATVDKYPNNPAEVAGDFPSFPPTANTVSPVTQDDVTGSEA
jgi:hypothetical protein